MPALVYLWLHAKRRGTVNATNHASLELSDGTYISWAFRNGGRDIGMQSYQDDIKREGRKPEREYIIKEGKLNEHAILSWWTRWRREETWRMQMPVLPMYTIFEALSVGLKGFDGSDSKGMYMTHTLLIDYMKNNKLVVSGGQCRIV